jgi:DNA phosphorothioation-dependent restriction protein DptG
MQTAGAIPKGKAFKTMTEEAARDSITRWYKTAVTWKLQAEKSEQSPEVRAQKKMSRRLRKQSTLGDESEKKKPTNPDAAEEGATEEK